MRNKYSLIVICILCVALGFSFAYNLQNNQTTSAIAAQQVNTPLDFRNGFVSIAEKLSPSVVYITSERTVDVSPNEDPFGGFFGFPFGGNDNQPRQRHETAGGSGVIVRSDGYVMTNDHVVGGADKVTVRLSDGREFKGKVLRDPKTDFSFGNN